MSWPSHVLTHSKMSFHLPLPALTSRSDEAIEEAAFRLRLGKQCLRAVALVQHILGRRTKVLSNVSPLSSFSRQNHLRMNAKYSIPQQEEVAHLRIHRIRLAPWIPPMEAGCPSISTSNWIRREDCERELRAGSPLAFIRQRRSWWTLILDISWIRFLAILRLQPVQFRGLPSAPFTRIDSHLLSIPLVIQAEDSGPIYQFSSERIR